MNNLNKPAEVMYETRYFQDLVVKERTARALHEGVARYPIFRQHRMAARVELEVYFDAIALDPSWRVERLHIENLLVDGDGIFIAAYGTRKLEYCSCVFNIWAADVERANAATRRLDQLAGPVLITEPRFVIDWHFRAGADIDSTEVEELANDQLID